MKKRKSHAFGKDIYLLGKSADGTLYWLEAGTWDCDWYWGFGYVETYTNNKYPERAKDISSHQHFDGLFFNKGRIGYHVFKEFFAETTVSDKELWTLLELMKSYYTARDYADLIYKGDGPYTTNPCRELIQDKREYDRINKVVIPGIMNGVYELLGGETEC